MDWLLVRCWYEYCGAVNGRNDLDACWLIAHDARIPLSPAGNVKKRIACALDPKIIPDNIACRGKGEHWLCCVGCCYEVETPAKCLRHWKANSFVLRPGQVTASVKLQQCRLATAAICRIQVCGLRNRGEKVKRKQLQRTGPQVFAPSQSSVSKFSYCVPMCVCIL